MNYLKDLSSGDGRGVVVCHTVLPTTMLSKYAVQLYAVMTILVPIYSARIVSCLARIACSVAVCMRLEN